MDPRHPELALARVEELIKQYKRVEDGINKAATSAAIAQLEREGSLVVQELALTVPRIHEGLMLASRNRRQELTRGRQLEGAPVRAQQSSSTSAEKDVETKESPKKEASKKKISKKAKK